MLFLSVLFRAALFKLRYCSGNGARPLSKGFAIVSRHPSVRSPSQKAALSVAEFRLPPSILIAPASASAFDIRIDI
jgi:hypothetical protein